MDFDAVIVGTGAGGGTLGYALARAGRRVLWLERGGMLDAHIARDDRAMLIERRAAPSEVLHGEAIQGRPLVGGVLGGSSSLYGAVLMRPTPDDFSPGRFFSAHLPRSMWDWPIQYDELLPYFCAAEQLYGVCGEANGFPLPETEQSSCYTAEPFPWTGEAGRLAAALQARGLHPFRLPLALDPATCMGCARCPGYGCPNGSRHGSADRCVTPAINQYGATLWLGATLSGVTQRGRTVTQLQVTQADGTVVALSCRVLVIAAGALGTPDLLQRLNLDQAHPALGRYLMMHLGVMFALLRPMARHLHAEPHKQLGLTDWYVVNGEKLGYVQQLPPPPPLVLSHELPSILGCRLPAGLLKPLYERLLLLVGAIDDLPQASNRIYRAADGRLCFHHRHHADDLRRAQLLKRYVKAALPPAWRRWLVVQIAARPHLRWAHQVGTCRFGHDAREAVADQDGRIHGLDNVFVADGSLLPSALGVGPSLTIIANALRIAQRLNETHL